MGLSIKTHRGLRTDNLKGNILLYQTAQFKLFVFSSWIQASVREKNMKQEA